MSIDTSSTARFVDRSRHEPPVVCVQGLGFVGTAMALAIASARDGEHPAFDVIGVEMPTDRGSAIASSLNAGRLPIESVDPKMQQALETARAAGNLSATTDPRAYELASVAV